MLVESEIYVLGFLQFFLCTVWPWGESAWMEDFGIVLLNLNAPDQHTPKTSVFTKVLKLAEG